MSMTMLELTDKSHKTANDKGWWEKFGYQELLVSNKLMLIVSEISEALEDLRVGGVENMATLWFDDTKDGKPEGFVVELADAIIRTVDLCREYNLDLETALVTKLEYNEKRPHRHGNKHL